MPHAQTRTSTTEPTTSTITPNTGQDFNALLQQLMDAIGGFDQLDPANIFSQLGEGSEFINSLSAALSNAFQPFVQDQLQGVADVFRQTGNEGALAGTGGPNRLTQVALPNALASINQQFGGQLTNLVGSVFGDLTQANIAGQSGQLGLINSIAQALGQIPTGQTTTASGTSAFEQLFGGGGGGGGGGSGASNTSLFQAGGGQLQPKSQFDPFRLQNTPGSPFFIERRPGRGVIGPS